MNKWARTMTKSYFLKTATVTLTFNLQPTTKEVVQECSLQTIKVGPKIRVKSFKVL